MEIYKKVYIKSEADLPKEKGRYAIGIKGTPFKTPYINCEDFNPDEDITKTFCSYRSSAKYWMESFDWYLLPVELPSDEEIEKHFKSQHFDSKNGHHYRINKDKINGAKWMRDQITKQ